QCERAGAGIELMYEGGSRGEGGGGGRARGEEGLVGEVIHQDRRAALDRVDRVCELGIGEFPNAGCLVPPSDPHDRFQTRIAQGGKSAWVWLGLDGIEAGPPDVGDAGPKEAAVVLAVSGWPARGVAS